jgi:hypothetical protein
MSLELTTRTYPTLRQSFVLVGQIGDKPLAHLIVIVRALAACRGL